MRARRSFVSLALLVGAIAVFPARASAQIDLGHPSITAQPFSNIGSGLDRSVKFGATADFSIASAGIRVDALTVPSFALRATVRTATDGASLGTRGDILAQATATFTDQGLAFYDVPLSFSFTAGRFYDIAFDVVGGDMQGWGFGKFSMPMFAFDALRNRSYAVGPVWVLDGGCFGACNGYESALMPHVRFDGASTIVPEPSTSLLLGAGLAVVGAVARRRRRA